MSASKAQLWPPGAFGPLPPHAGMAKAVSPCTVTSALPNAPRLANHQTSYKNTPCRDSARAGSYTRGYGNTSIDYPMRQLANRPLFLAAILAIPLWFVLDNFVVAAMVALLVAFLAAMVNSLRILKKGEQQPQERSNGN
ncbi:hypothetical protein C7440_0300 [Pusillimonas noertemannii]|uniref:Uncharacterized protein n=2 Tax=Pusillimonas noertemannii TaxID=305977 RepID=A0A2U1CPZ9_9BURK|nr:hypothetical protein C7440_0300 [Pusillimonas noertemannii]